MGFFFYLQPHVINVLHIDKTVIDSCHAENYTCTSTPAADMSIICVCALKRAKAYPRVSKFIRAVKSELFVNLRAKKQCVYYDYIIGMRDSKRFLQGRDEESPTRETS